MEEHMAMEDILDGDGVAVLDPQFLNDALLHGGENVAAIDRFERSLRFDFEIRRPKKQKQNDGQDRRTDRERFRQGAGLHDPAGISDRTPEGHQEQVLMFE